MPREYFGLHSLRVLIQLIQSELEELEKKIGTGGGSVEVIDNLTTADATKALSANQGKVLDEKVANLKSTLESKIVTDIAAAMSSLREEITSAATKAANDLETVRTELTAKIESIDSDGDGVADNAAKLGGHDASNFATVEQLEEAGGDLVEIDEDAIEAMWNEVLGEGSGSFLEEDDEDDFDFG